MQDWQLLRRYVSRDSEEAFAEIVRRYSRLVYGTCLRETGDRTLSEDAALAVFVILARKARRLRRESSLAPWLFKTARYVSMNAATMERRRANREASAFTQRAETLSRRETSLETGPELDQAIAALGSQDREAILLRFYEGLSHREIAECLGITEKAAQMRVTRATERLRKRFRHEALASTPEALCILLSTPLPHPVPSGFAHAATQAACPQTPGTGIASISSPAQHFAQGALNRMLLTRIEIAGAAAAAIGGFAIFHHAPQDRCVIPSSAMEPSFPAGSVVSVDSRAYASVADVRRGDVILYSRPANGLHYVKRVMGLPRDVVRVSGQSIWINGRPVPHTGATPNQGATVYQERLDNAVYTVQYRAVGGDGAPAQITVPDNSVFVLGDNRDNSVDSRTFGAVPFASVLAKETAIIGKTTTQPAEQVHIAPGQEAKFVEQARRLRELLRPWADSHRALFAQIDAGHAGGETVFLAICNSVPREPLGDGDPRFGSPGTEPTFSTLGEAAPHPQMSSPEGQAMQAAFAKYHDIPISRSLTPGTVNIVLWASGRITRETRTFNTGKPWITDATQEELEGPFFPRSEATH